MAEMTGTAASGRPTRHVTLRLIGRHIDCPNCPTHYLERQFSLAFFLPYQTRGDIGILLVDMMQQVDVRTFRDDAPQCPAEMPTFDTEAYQLIEND